METIKVKVSEVKNNPNNPRLIRDDKFKKLVKSIQEFPEMLDLRPVVVNAEMMVLGGNMRFKAAKEAGMKEVPIIITNLSEEKQRQFIIKDNVSGGEWDWDVLANEWDVEELSDWGINVELSDNFAPNMIPETNYSDVTKEEIQKEAEKLANQMIRERGKIECICPECGTEFEIDA